MEQKRIDLLGFEEEDLKNATPRIHEIAYSESEATPMNSKQMPEQPHAQYLGKYATVVKADLQQPRFEIFDSDSDEIPSPMGPGITYFDPRT